MSPDIEWRISDDAEPETVVTSSRRPSRARTVGVAVAVCLGIGLGLLYRSIPEPPPRPAPTAVPTPAPAPPPQVTDTIDQEAVALASGDLRTFLNLQDAADPTWYQAQLGFFRTWGRPTSGPLYTKVASGTLTGDRLWADIVQFRRGQYFRQTRFYQLKDERWRRVAPATDASFWGEEQAAATAHFNLKFRARDAGLAAAIAEQYEAIYARACRDLKCPDQGTLPAEGKLQIILGPEVTTPLVDWRNNQLIYTLPSPSLAGLTFQTQPGHHPSPDRPFNQSVVESIVYYIARLSASHISTWPQDVSSVQFLGIIADWENLRLMGQPSRRLLAYPDQLASRDLPDLATLWDLAPINSSQMAELRWIESTALIVFIDEHYGADKVVTFLHALGQAASLSDVIQSMGVSYPDFQQKWRAWLKQIVAANDRADSFPRVQ
jgi:hypothetical protein